MREHSWRLWCNNGKKRDIKLLRPQDANKKDIIWERERDRENKRARKSKEEAQKYICTNLQNMLYFLAQYLSFHQLLRTESIIILNH